MARMRLVLAALWWGSLTGLGAWVVPLLFVHLPTPALAGGMAARLFTAQTWVSAICGLLLLLMAVNHQKSWKYQENRAVAPESIAQAATIFVVAGMLLALLSEFAVAPRIVARENLKLWHAVGSAMYLLQWGCAGGAFWKLMPQTGRAP